MQRVNLSVRFVTTRTATRPKKRSTGDTIIIMYIDEALINVPSAHIININLNMIFYTHVEHSPTKTIVWRDILLFFRGALRPHKPYGLLGTGWRDH